MIAPRLLTRLAELARAFDAASDEGGPVTVEGELLRATGRALALLAAIGPRSRSAAEVYGFLRAALEHLHRGELDRRLPDLEGRTP